MCFKLLFALLVAIQVGSLVGANHEEPKSLFNSKNLIEMPESCTGQTFCFEKGDNYPDETMNKLVENLRDVELKNPEARIDIGYRSANGASNGEMECKTNFSESPIYYITDSNNETRVVVQQPENFMQIYSLTWCLEEGQPSGTEHFLKNTKCKTSTMALDFFVLSDNYVDDFQTPKMTIATAKIPVCCKCLYDAEEVNKQFTLERQNNFIDQLSVQ